MKRAYYFLSAIFLSNWAWGSSSAHETSHGVPSVVYYQAINVLIIFVAGIILGREKVAQFFKQKRNQFLLDQDKAQSVLQNAQVENTEASRRLEKLRSTREEVLAKAKTDASDLKRQMVSDAEMNSKKMHSEAQQMARVQIERAKKELRLQLITEAFELSKRDLSAKATSADQKKLQEDFISKVQVVQ